MHRPQFTPDGAWLPDQPLDGSGGRIPALEYAAGGMAAHLMVADWAGPHGLGYAKASATAASAHRCGVQGLVELVHHFGPICVFGALLAQEAGLGGRPERRFLHAHVGRKRRVQGNECVDAGLVGRQAELGEKFAERVDGFFHDDLLRWTGVQSGAWMHLTATARAGRTRPAWRGWHGNRAVHGTQAFGLRGDHAPRFRSGLFFTSSITA